MENVETFVALSVHKGTNADGQAVKFIRARFQVSATEWLTAFNPKGVAKLELVRRVSATTGKTRIETRWPVLVRFVRDTAIGSDVVAQCELEPRAFTPKAMQSADAADLARLAAMETPVGTAPDAAKPAQAPAEPAEEPLA